MERLAEENSMADTQMESNTMNTGNPQGEPTTGTNPGYSGAGTVGAGPSNTVNMNTGTMNTGNVNTGDINMGNADNGVGPKRMLYRHPQDRLIGGVCAGLGELIGMDANLVRILWVVATLITGGGGIIAYLALWMLLPVGTVATGQVRPPTFALNGLNMGRTAIVLIGLGVIWLLANFGVLPWLWGSFWRLTNVLLWPAILIGVGYLLLRYSGRGEFKLNWNWRESGQRMQNGVADRMPTKQSLKESYNSFRQHLPLHRSRTDRIFMGVCGGIGQRIGIDANLVRLVWAAFSVGSIGMGVLIYVLLGLFLTPEEVTSVQPYVDDAQDVQVIDARATKL